MNKIIMNEMSKLQNEMVGRPYLMRRMDKQVNENSFLNAYEYKTNWKVYGSMRWRWIDTKLQGREKTEEGHQITVWETTVN
jgi:hypothetical protein